MGPKQILPLEIKVDLGVIRMKWWLYMPQKLRIRVSPLDAVSCYIPDVNGKFDLVWHNSKTFHEYIFEINSNSLQGQLAYQRPITGAQNKSSYNLFFKENFMKEQGEKNLNFKLKIKSK